MVWLFTKELAKEIVSWFAAFGQFLEGLGPKARAWIIAILLFGYGYTMRGATDAWFITTRRPLYIQGELKIMSNLSQEMEDVKIRLKSLEHDREQRERERERDQAVLVELRRSQDRLEGQQSVILREVRRLQ